MNKTYNPDNIEAGFKSYLEENSFSRTSIHNYLADVRSFLKWFSQDLQAQRLAFDISILNKKTIRRYTDFLRITKTPIPNINRTLSSIRTLGKYLSSEKILQTDPAKDIKNIKHTSQEALYFWLRSHTAHIIAFAGGFLLVTTMIIIPGIIASEFPELRTDREIPDTATHLNIFPDGVTASTSAGLLTIPIIDQQGSLYLTAPYPKIIGETGTLLIEAPELFLAAAGEGNIKLQADEGTIHFLFDGERPRLPYESAFYFSAENLQSGALIYGELGTESRNVSLLELSSGTPKETKFRVDGEGNVYIKGNIVLEGNLIMNPDSIIFGTTSEDTATSSASPGIQY